MGLHIDYIIANFSRYFSSHELRLSYKGSLETKEFITSKLLLHYNISTDHLPFIGILLGACIHSDENTIKSIHQKLHIDGTNDFETKLTRIVECVRKSTSLTDVEEFIKCLDLAEHSDTIRIAAKYYQDKVIALRPSRGKKKILVDSTKKDDQSIPATNASTCTSTGGAMASETNETDEMTRKLLNEVNNLVNDDDEQLVMLETPLPEMKKDDTTTATTAATKSSTTRPRVQFVYTLPAEVLKTSLNRHQRGIMDAKIYHLLTKKEIFLPQILEDEQYREIPSVHLFYRPARQMIYAILFNMYHQKYLIGKKEKPTNGTKSLMPEITINEWIWSPQNEYKKAEPVGATLLSWAVPTIQRLWFGTLFEDKQRRMKAFLTVMRSDSPLMLNSDYVPQHMLAMACVLRLVLAPNISEELFLISFVFADIL